MYKEKEWGDDKRQELKKKIRMVHLQYKADLVHLSNELMKQTLKRPKNEWAPYLNPATQASSVAVWFIYISVPVDLYITVPRV